MYAQGMEQRWKKSIQHERQRRTELEENMEALAKQMHGLESAARRASQKGLDKISLESSQSSASLNDDSQSLDNGTKLSRGGYRVKDSTDAANKKGVSFDLPMTYVSPPTSLMSNENSDEDDQFFDATEPMEDPLDAPDKPFTNGATKSFHKRNISSVSMNESQLHVIPSTVSPENLPSTVSEGRLKVIT